MFCTNCGKELADDVIFCPFCGTKRMKISDMDSAREADTGQYRKDSSMGAEMGDHESGETEPSGNIIFRIWDSPMFTIAAIKFGNMLEIVGGIIFIILSILLFGEGGFWGVAWGIFLILSGLAGCINGTISLLSRKKNNDEGEVLDKTTINKKKRNLCIGIVVMIIVMAVAINTGGAHIYS